MQSEDLNINTTMKIIEAFNQFNANMEEKIKVQQKNQNTMVQFLGD